MSEERDPQEISETEKGSPPPVALGSSAPESGKSITTRDTAGIGRAPEQQQVSSSGGGGKSARKSSAFKFDVGDIACKAYWEKNKDDENWNTTIFDKETLEKKQSVTSEKAEYHTTEPVTYPLVKQHQEAMGEQMAGLLHHANVTYQLQDSYNKFNEGKLNLEVPEEMKAAISRADSMQKQSNKRLFTAFLSIGIVLIVLGLGMVFYTYTFLYNPTIRIAGATCLNIGLMMEIFTVASSKGGLIL